MYKLYLDSTGSWDDVSDYVTSIGRIPFINKNQDNSLTTDGFTFTLSENYNNTYIESTDRVKVTVDSVVIFVGLVSKIKKNYNDKTYEIDVVSNLSRLQLEYITYANLHSAIASTTTYESSDSLSLPNVSLLELLVVMFDDADLTLDITTNSVASKTIAYQKTVVDSVSSAENSYDYTFEDIRIDENMLYAVNQMYATDYTLTEEQYRITYFDFISYICSYLSLIIYPDGLGENGFILKHNTTDESYTISDDYKYSYDIDKDVDSRDNWTANYNAPTDLGVYRYGYNTTDKDVLYNIVVLGNDYGTSIKYYNSLILLLRDHSYSPYSANDLNPMVSWGSDRYGFLTVEDSNSSGFNVGQRLTDYYEKSLILRRYETNIQTTRKDVLMNEIDLQNRISIITEIV